MPAKKKVDWNKARQDYLSDTTLSMQDIADKYGVSKQSVTKRASVEGWSKIRQKLSETAFEDFQSKLLDEKSKAQNRHLIQYQNLQAIVNRGIVGMSEGSFWTDKKGNLVFGKDEKPIPKPLDGNQLVALAKAAKIAMDGERTVLGLPTNVQGLTDGNGDSVWTGFSDMVKMARKVKNEANGNKPSGRDTGNTGGNPK